MDIRITNEFPFLMVNDFPVYLEDWSVGSDPTSVIDQQNGFRVVFGEETSCKSRCDGFFFRSVEAAIKAAKHEIELWEEAGDSLTITVMVKGFLFRD